MQQKATNQSHILIVDDEEGVRNGFSRLLKLAGYTVFAVENAKKALAYLKNNHVDLAILDHCLHPKASNDGINGTELMQEIRLYWTDIAIILLTKYPNEDSSHSALMHNVAYLVKPLNGERLQDSIRHLLGKNSKEEDVLIVGDIALYPKRREAWVGKIWLSLTAIEFDVLAYFMKKIDIAISRQDLAETVLGCSVEESRAKAFCKNHVWRVRKKLQEHFSEHQYIETIQGFGYRMIPQQDDT